MNWVARRISIAVCIACLVIGSAGYGFGPPFLPPSWLGLYGWVPGTRFVYPALYLANAGLALVGIWHAPTLRASYGLLAALFGVWGMMGAILTVQGRPGGNWPGTCANFLFAFLAGGYVYYVQLATRGDAQNAQIAQLGEKAESAREELDAP